MFDGIAEHEGRNANAIFFYEIAIFSCFFLIYFYVTI